ncbi:putative signal transduction histidine kinase [Emticicia oligotrophica DSM 17448]|uniref:Signal transduction histidine kinase n=1 Tax=Emticicia oligotrophica (strain DSM 17448 / CIP 109782 / MTCC 6937 / GPTSA100-15) TaxID=929562 RepID=A0ABN4AMU7_EMTOG|nr:histidine kinase [Emticicia oligotrophica]AFK03508.1 putative signal transduction histidine kinase [Emticicia oligotrophica DSM 17448]
MNFLFGNLLDKAYWKEVLIPFFKRHWLIILSILTALSIAHTLWYFTYKQPFSELIDTFLKFKQNKNYNKNYSSWYQLGYLGATLIRSQSFLFSLIGSSILIAEFNYQFLFKNLFVDEGRKGKFFYFVVLIFFYFFIFIVLLSSFGVKSEPLGLHSFITNVWIGFSVIYSVIQYVSESHKRIRELAIQKTKVELSALKAQINPHFLFNVLNNLYGTAIVEESPKTAEGIQQLSSIMRHVVEGTKNERITADKEVQFLYDFIELNKMRIPKRENIKIKIDIDFDEQPTQIAPLLVIPYIENAFKFGISINQESFIDISFKIENQQLHFSCRNSIIKQVDKLEIGTSTGLENTRRRLILNYPQRHHLKISNDNNVFEVVLDVNLI